MDYDLLLKCIATGCDYDTFCQIVGEDHVNYSVVEDPTVSDTIGQLIDKISIVNNKMWVNQEVIYSIRRMSTDEFIAKWGSNLPKLHEAIKKCADLNVQRAHLMDAIDQKVVDAISGKIPLDKLQARQHKTY